MKERSQSRVACLGCGPNLAAPHMQDRTTTIHASVTSAATIFLFSTSPHHHASSHLLAFPVPRPRRLTRAPLWRPFRSRSDPTRTHANPSGFSGLHQTGNGTCSSRSSHALAPQRSSQRSRIYHRCQANAVVAEASILGKSSRRQHIYVDGIQTESHLN